MAESFEDMRQEAIRRVMEMQQRSQGLTGSDGRQTDAGGASASGANASSGGSSPLRSPLQASPSAGKLTDLLSGLDIDEEKALIALLIYILWKNGADKKLLFGLGYLIL